MHRVRLLAAVGCLLLFGLLLGAFKVVHAAEPVMVGLARRDVTPTHPVRMSGYFGRKEEATEAEQRLWAKAIAIGSDAQHPAILVTLDNLGVPATMTANIASRLGKRFGIEPEGFAICASHTHCAPAVLGVAPLIVSDPTDEVRQHIAEYTRELEAAIEEVAAAALADRKPAELSWAVGTAGFAANRRVLKQGAWSGFGVNPGAPVDHRLPVLRVTDPSGKLRGVLVNYACHCTTLGGDFNKFCGDWAGYAQELIERDHPGTVAMVAIGCAADANPQPRSKLADAQQHGDELRREVNRLLQAGEFRPLPAVTEARAEQIELPFDTLPTREEWEKRAATKGAIAIHAKKNLERLDRGEKLPTTMAYRIAAWNFGDALAMVFLPGEVVVDYALRLEREYRGKPLWINAYSNDDPCYIASKRVIGEGGYEVDSSMYYYDRPTHFSPEIEEMIVQTVGRLLPASFGKPVVAGTSKWAEAIEAFATQDREHPPQPGGIVFVGSSSIRRWPLQEYFPELPVLNRGFGGSQLADSVEFAYNIVTPYKPSTVVLYAGDNDLAAGKSPQEVAADFEAFIRKVRPALPEAKILYLSIKPSPKRWSIVDKGREANRLIEHWIATSGDKRLEFVDVATPLLGNDGQPRPELYADDKLHLSDAGYKIWADILRPLLTVAQTPNSAR
ncbi:MAG TPA: neutral/alkaline non-lysosomal ceramidase N-terminal domain-containing protein [Pirellulales bacterium]|jgi:lysophospholipase L1-like esterase|nr:neutral/alkaline non-lysosomal ceramidase N-terminal domain-containing protein [Pirellulales bacterium]